MLDLLWIIFVTCVLLTIIFIYESWMIFVKRKYGLLFLDSPRIPLLGNILYKYSARLEKYNKKHPKQIYIPGFYSLVGIFLGLYVSIKIISTLLHFYR